MRYRFWRTVEGLVLVGSRLERQSPTEKVLGARDVGLTQGTWFHAVPVRLRAGELATQDYEGRNIHLHCVQMKFASLTGINILFH